MAKKNTEKSAAARGNDRADHDLPAGLTYEDKEKRLDEILIRLDNSETPMDELASEAREAAALIMSMHATLKATRQEITTVFEELERHKESIAGDEESEEGGDSEDT